MALAGAIKGITIEIGGDTKKLVSALNDVNKKTSSLQSELKKVDKGLKLDPKNTELLSQKQTILKDAIAATTTKLDALKQAQDKVEKANKANSNWENRYAPLKKQIDETTEKMNKLASQDAAMKKKLESGQINAEQYKAYQQELESVSQKHKSLMQSKRDLEKQFEDGHISDAEYREYQRTVIETENKLKSLQTELAETNNAFLNVSNNLGKAGSVVSDLGEKTSRIGNALTVGVTMPLVGVATAAINVGNDFEEGMSKVAAISGATGDELDALTEKAKEMGAKTKFSATESAAAFEYMAMAGWKTDDMLNGIEGIMNLAAASGEDLASVSDIVTDALTAFGLQASDSAHFADVLAKASSSSNTNVGLMGATFKYVAPIAGSMKYSIEDTAVAIGLMANSGIKGEQAGTALRSTLSRLVDPPKEAAAALEDLGISAVNADGSMKPLNEVMVTLREKFKGLDDSQKASYASSIAGTEAMSGFLAIVSASDDDFNNLTEAINNADGTAQDMADTMQDNTKGAIVEMTGSLETASITLQKSFAPHITNAAKKVTELSNKFSALPSKTQKNIVKFAALTAAIGPAVKCVGALEKGLGATITTGSKIIGTVGKVTASTTSLTGATKAAAVAQGLLNAAWKANPAGLIIGGVVALGAAIAAVTIAVKKSTEAKKESKEAWNEIAQGAEEFRTGLESAESKLSTFDATLFASSETQQELADNMQEVQDAITTICQTATEERRGLTESEIQQLDEYFQKLRELQQQQLDQEMTVSQAISQQALTEVESYKGTLAEYQATAQQWIATAQEQAAKQTQIIEQQATTDISILNQKYGDQANLSNEAYKKEYDDIVNYKEQQLEAVQSGLAEINSAYANGYAERTELGDIWTRDVAKNHLTIEEESERHAARMEYLSSTEAALQMSQVDLQKALSEESKTHAKNIQQTWADLSASMSEEEKNQLGVILSMAANTVEAGGELTEETKSIVTAIAAAYDGMDEDTQAKFDELFDTLNLKIDQYGNIVFASGEHYGEMLSGGIDSSDVKTATKNKIAEANQSVRDEVEKSLPTVNANGQNLINGLNDGQNSVDTATPAALKVGEIVSATDNTFAKAELQTKGATYGAKPVVGFAGGMGANIGLVTAQVGSVSDKVSTLSSFDSYTWGSHLAQGFANGISDNVKLIGNAALAGAEAAKAVLHFTRPDKGPLRDYEEWPVHFVSRYAELMKSQKPKLSNAALSLADSISAAMDTDTAAKYQAMIDDIQHPKLVFPAPETSSPAPAQQSVDNQPMQISGTLHATIVMPDGRVLAEATAPYNNIELNKMLEAGRRYR